LIISSKVPQVIVTFLLYLSSQQSARQVNMVLAEKQEEAQHVETVEEVGAVTDEEDHRETKWQAVKSNKKTLAWISIMILVMCLQGFDNQAGGIVIGIEQFRKDFGTPFDGNYVLPAKWQVSVPYQMAHF